MTKLFSCFVLLLSGGDDDTDESVPVNFVNATPPDGEIAAWIGGPSWGNPQKYPKQKYLALLQ